MNISLSIKQKILVIPVVGIVGFLVYLAFIYTVTSENSTLLASIRTTYYPSLEIANANISRLEQVSEIMVNAVMTGDTDTLENAEDVKDKLLSGLDTQEKLQPLRKQEIANIKDSLLQYYEFSFKLSEGMINEELDMSTVGEMASNKKQLFNTVTKNLDDYMNKSQLMFTESLDSADRSSRELLNIGFVIAVITISLILVTSISIVSSISKSLLEVTNTLKDIAHGEGDLTRRINNSSNDEIGDLCNFFNLFIEKLQATISDVISVIEPLNNASHKMEAISTGTIKISGTQYESSEKVSATLTNLLTSVSDVTRYATLVADETAEANDEAKQGLSVVTSNIDSIQVLADDVDHAAVVIHQLNTDAENVGSILDVIRSIAEQTNLLALNAAIEAARAGEQGRGFAVVADEVRTLASRTQESTEEIQTMLEKLQTAASSAVHVMEKGKDQTKISVDQAEQTGISLSSISKKIESITSMNTKIATITSEQENVANVIQSDALKMRDLAAEVVDDAKNSADVCNAITGLSDQLKGIAGQFKV